MNSTPEPKRLGEDEGVAGPGAGIGDDPLGVDPAVHAQAVLRLLVVHGMAAHQAGAGLHHLVMPAAQDLPQKAQIQMLGREHDQIEGGQRHPAHGIDVGDGVGRGDLAEPVGIVHRRGDEVHGVDHGDLVGQPVHRRVVARFR